MSTLYLHSGGIDYEAQPVAGFGNGTLSVVQYDAYATWRTRIQQLRAAGGEVINYLLPTTDYTRGFNQQKEIWGATSAIAQANSWFFDNANPDRLNTPAYFTAGSRGRVMNIRGSVPGGTSYMRNFINVCVSYKNNPNWQLDGFFFDVTGDDSVTGAITGWASQAERDDFNAGMRLLCQMARQALGENIIIINNNFWKETNPDVNGCCIEHHFAYQAWMGTSMARCTRAKRRHIAIVTTAADAETYKNTLCTHITIQPIGSYVTGPFPTTGDIGNGTWPTDALHLQGYDSVTDTSGGGSSLSAPTNVSAPVLSGTATVGNTLTTSDGTWTGNPGPTFSYQWLRNGLTITDNPPGTSTANAYLLVSADNGTNVSCRVTGSNSQGSAPATSNSLPVTTSGGGGVDTTPPLAPTAISVDTNFAGSGDPYLLVTIPDDPDRSTATSAGLKIYRKTSAWTANQASSAGTLSFTMTGSGLAAQPSFPLLVLGLTAGTYYFKGFTYDDAGNEQTGGPSASWTVAGGAPWVYGPGFAAQQIPAGGGGGSPGTAAPWVISAGFAAQQVPVADTADPSVPPVASNARLTVGRAGTPTTRHRSA